MASGAESLRSSIRRSRLGLLASTSRKLVPTQMVSPSEAMLSPSDWHFELTFRLLGDGQMLERLRTL